MEVFATDLEGEEELRDEEEDMSAELEWMEFPSGPPGLWTSTLSRHGAAFKELYALLSFSNIVEYSTLAVTVLALVHLPLECDANTCGAVSPRNRFLPIKADVGGALCSRLMLSRSRNWCLRISVTLDR